MKKHTFLSPLLVVSLLFPMTFAIAEEPLQAQQNVRQERIYGNQLMTKQERIEFRKKLRAAKTREERQRIRNEHHEAMKLRAKERGIELPDQPPMRGMKDRNDKGQAMGPGGGKGMGQGAGKGAAQGNR